MAAIPQGAFAACKVRNNLERNALITSMEKEEKTGKENTFNKRPPLEGTYQLLNYQLLILLLGRGV